MINFKQGDSYGNNFNNGDEAKLSDSTRPRDEFGFKIQPGVQSSKWNLRSSNKGLVEYFSVCGGIEITGIAQASMNYSTSVTIPLYTDCSGKFTASQNYPYTMDQEESMCNTEKIGSLGWGVKNGRVYIPADGIYFIQYQCEFLWQSSVETHDTSASPKLHLQLTYFDTKGNKVGPLDNTDVWGIVNPDLLSGVSLQALKGGESIGIDAIHGRNGIKSFCRGILKVQKLS